MDSELSAQGTPDLSNLRGGEVDLYQGKVHQGGDGHVIGQVHSGQRQDGVSDYVVDLNTFFPGKWDQHTTSSNIQPYHWAVTKEKKRRLELNPDIWGGQGNRSKSKV